MKKFKSVLPTVCYTVLLLAIALLSFLIAGKSSDKPISAEEKTAPKAQEKTQPETYEPTSTEKPPTEEQTETSTEEPTDTAILPYDDVFPRRSQDGKQKIYGDGNVLLNGVTQTAVGNFIALTSDCANGDIPCEKSSLALVKMNNENDLISYVILGETERFLTMQITCLGLVVLSENENKTHATVRIVDIDLTIKQEYKISDPSSTRILPTQDSFLLFADYENECILYRYLNEKLIFQSVEKGTLVELFEGEESYLLFCNKADGSYCLTLEKERLLIKSAKKLTDSTLLGIVPVYENGQYYLTVENETTVKIRKYDASLQLIETRDFGACNIDKTYPCEQGLLLLCSGSLSGYAWVSSDLTFRLHEDTSLVSQTVVAFTVIENAFTYLLRGEDDVISFMGKEPIGKAKNASFVLTPTETFILYLEKTDEHGRSYIEITPLSENR